MVLVPRPDPTPFLPVSVRLPQNHPEIESHGSLFKVARAFLLAVEGPSPTVPPQDPVWRLTQRRWSAAPQVSKTVQPVHLLENCPGPLL